MAARLKRELNEEHAKTAAYNAKITKDMTDGLS